jgi:DNA-binding SARP family transcriptional activator/tetratricopeptide (TPR) repeat protein
VAVVLLNRLNRKPVGPNVVFWGDRLVDGACGGGVNVRVLGPLEVDAGGCLVRLGPQQRRVFLVLLLQAGQVLSGPRLAELVWGEPVPEGAAATLRSHVMRLRRALQSAQGPGSGETGSVEGDGIAGMNGITLIREGGGYALRVRSERVDAVRFEHLLRQGREALAAADPVTAAEVLRSGLGLWRGPVLVEVADQPFALAEVARLEGLRRVALLARIEADLAVGRHGEVVGELEGLVAAAPREETLRRYLAVALYRCHRLEDAAWVCQQGLALLLDRGLDSPRLQELQAKILCGAPELDWIPGQRGPVLSRPTHTAVGGPQALPRDVPSFVGRHGELRQLLQAVTGRMATGGVVGIHAIGGMAGIGKTAFAVHASHQLAAHFPDGQIFLRLHAHTPGQRPVDAAEALSTLLLTVGIAPQRIPASLEARELLWRDHLAGKKVLLVLDDAVGQQQIDPLLPGTADSLVIITSRRRLTALDDAGSISLDILTPAEAVALFLRVAARPDLEPTDAAIAEVTRLCGYLPLAIRLMAGRLRHPTWTPANLVAELATTRDRLTVIEAGERSVAAAFNLSYQDLTAPQQQLFRRLGLQPGPEIDAYAAAALHDITLLTARRHLEGLYDLHLLEEPVRGRYRLHDLLRDYARTLAERDPPAERDTAVDRLLDYYLHTAALAAPHLTLRTPTTIPAVAHPPRAIPDLATPDAAVTWLRTEAVNLHAATDYAARYNRHHHAIYLPAAMHEFLHAQSPCDQALILHHTALDVARRTGNPLAQATTLNNLGIMQYQSGDYPAATTNLEQSLALHRDLGHELGEAGVLSQLGTVQCLTGDYPAAATSLHQALTLYRDLGHRLGEADTLNWVGLVQAWTGNYRAASTNLEHALALHRDLGHRLGEANALGARGSVQCLTGDYRAGITNLEQALRTCRELGHRLGEAHLLAQLGMAQVRAGDYPAAGISLQQALTTCRDLGHRYGEAEALNGLGTVLWASSAVEDAHAHHVHALGIAQALGTPLQQARALEGIGRCQLRQGHTSEGATHLHQACTLYRRLGSPDVARVETTLTGLRER